jgi:hypothetical protein
MQFEYLQPNIHEVAVLIGGEDQSLTAIKKTSFQHVADKPVELCEPPAMKIAVLELLSGCQ